jgi:hypothetical protein
LTHCVLNHFRASLKDQAIDVAVGLWDNHKARLKEFRKELLDSVITSIENSGFNLELKLFLLSKFTKSLGYKQVDRILTCFERNLLHEVDL